MCSADLPHLTWGVGGFVGRDCAVATAMPASSAAPASKLLYASFEQPKPSQVLVAQACPALGTRAALPESSPMHRGYSLNYPAVPT
jgi:hypothetical protein